MKTLLTALMLALGLAALPAAADHERGRGAYGVRPDFRVQQGPPGQYYRGDPRRDPRGDRQMDRRGAERPQGRLTDEERRDLRRDLDKADRELYRRRAERR